MHFPFLVIFTIYKKLVKFLIIFLEMDVSHPGPSRFFDVRSTITHRISGTNSSFCVK